MTDHNQTRNHTRRIGLFGGTFNPIHRAHVKVAEEVLQKFNLDHIHLIPSARPPHKTHGILASAENRIEMASLALDGRPDITVSDIETRRVGPSYTIDTLKAFTAAEDETELFFLLGVDAFMEIHTWKSYRQLFDLCAFILMTRPSADASSPLPSLAIEYARHHISDRYMMAPNGHGLIHPDKKTIYPVQVTPMAIASSRIRIMVRHGEPTHGWLSPAVADYIDSKGLYR